MEAVKGYAAHSCGAPLKPFDFQRRALEPTDVALDILYCGICHSDVHMVHNDWGRSQYPLVPGHEIIGVVTAIGNEVTAYAVGDSVGVGCMVDACRTCHACEQDLAQFCRDVVMTYGSPDPKLPEHITQGGYSSAIVVDQDFVLRIPEGISLPHAAPLLCAGITTYSPLKHWQVQPGHKVGIIGLGGLGHMAIQITKAMGAHVVAITASESKKSSAFSLGADAVCLSTDAQQMADHDGVFDLLLNTIPVQHDVTPYMGLLKHECTLVMLGATPIDLHSMSLLFGRKYIAGSLIGGIHETQEMLAFCAEHNIRSEIECIHIQDINRAYKRLLAGDIACRFVIDMQSLQ